MSFLRHGEIYHFDEGAIPQDRTLAHRDDEFPDGYSLQEIKRPLAESAQMALLIYSGAGGELTLLQGTIGLIPAKRSSQAVIATVNVTNSIFKKEAMIAGYPAAWIDGKQLEWKTESYFYELSGSNLSLIEATHIAESVR